MKTWECVLTVAMGKRLIAKGLLADEQVKRAMTQGKLLIVAGTTNAYVAEEALRMLGDETPFDAKLFRRGITVAPGAKVTPGMASFDLLIDHGKAYFDRDVFAIAPEMGAGDVLLKGGNAVHLPTHEAGVLIGHPQGGTTMPILSAVIGRRVQLVVPIGLEKRVDCPIATLTALANADTAEGSRLCPLPGRVFTELDAVQALTGAQATLLAAGGAMGAEGCVYLAIRGESEQIERAKQLVSELRSEPAMVL